MHIKITLHNSPFPQWTDQHRVLPSLHNRLEMIVGFIHTYLSYHLKLDVLVAFTLWLGVLWGKEEDEKTHTLITALSAFICVLGYFSMCTIGQSAAPPPRQTPSLVRKGRTYSVIGHCVRWLRARVALLDSQTTGIQVPPSGDCKNKDGRSVVAPTSNRSPSIFLLGSYMGFYRRGFRCRFIYMDFCSTCIICR